MMKQNPISTRFSNMLTLDCRDKLTLEDGSTCIFMKNRAFADLPRFDLYAPSGALLVKCRIIGKLFRYLSFTDAGGRELATIRFKWSLPILHLPDGSKTELHFFRHQGTDFCSDAEVELLGSTLCCTDGVFSMHEDHEPEQQGLLKAVLCFCSQYPKAREIEVKRAFLLALALNTALGVGAWCRVSILF